MPTKIVWRHEARTDLIQVLDEISEKNPRAAVRYVEEIETKVGGLSQFPERAQAYHDTYRMLVVRNHSVFYRYDEDLNTVFVISVIYGGKDLEEIMGPRN